MKKLIASLLLAAAAPLALTACDGVNNPGDGSGMAGGGGSGGHGHHIKLTVLAASSLTGAFGTLAKTYEAQHKGTKVDLVLDSSATLVQQLQQGAPGGILATADKKTMDSAVAAHLIKGTPYEFASNTMVLVVPASNPAHISSFADLAKPGVKYLTCVPSAPCGNLADQLLSQDKITAKPASQETDVKAVLAKIESGDADAGLVYATDAKAAGTKVKSFTIPGAATSPNLYYIAITSGAKHLKAAEAWLKLLKSQAGQQALSQAGFGAAK